MFEGTYIPFPRPIILGIKMLVWFWCIFPQQSPMIYGSPPTKNNHTSPLNILNAEAGGDLPAPKGENFCVSTHKLPGRPLKLLTGEFFLSFFSSRFSWWNNWKWLGGFKYFLFSPLPGEMIQFDKHIFQRGWNHQLGSSCWICLFSFFGRLVW